MTDDQSWMCIGLAAVALVVGVTVGGGIAWFRALRQIDRALERAFK